MHHHRPARSARCTWVCAVPRRRSCGKRFYADRISADLSLAVIKARGRVRGKEPIRSYACPRCGGWHLTSAPRRRPPVGLHGHDRERPR